MLPWLSRGEMVPSYPLPSLRGLTAETLPQAGKGTKRALSVCQDINSKQLAGLSGARSAKGIHFPSVWIFHLLHGRAGGRAQAQAFIHFLSPASTPSTGCPLGWVCLSIPSPLPSPPLAPSHGSVEIHL